MTNARIIQLDETALTSVRAHGGEGLVDFARVVDGDAFPGSWHFCDYAVIPPGSSIGVHRHGADEELYLVLEGAGRMTLDGETVRVRPGTLIVNRPGGLHGLVNDSDRPLKIFVVEVALKAAQKFTRPAFTALVMAGGRGTRMANAHPSIPKPLVPIAGRPLIEWSIRRALRAGADEVVLALGHGAAAIETYVASLESPVRARIRTFVEDAPLGTIGALGRIDVSPDRTVVVTNGDLLSAIPLKTLLDRHHAAPADLTIAVHPETHRLTLGEVVADADGAVVDYLEKPLKTYRISSGVYAVGPRARALASAGERLDFPELVRRAIAEGLVVREFRHSSPWIDVNDDDGVRAAHRLLDEHGTAFEGAEE